MMRRSYRNKKRNRLLIIAGALVCLLSITALFVFNTKPAVAVARPTIQTIGELISYSQNYGADNMDDEFEINITSGEMKLLSESGFVSIGSDAYPFGGKIKIVSTSPSTFYSDVPLFGTVTTDMKIVDENDDVRTITIINTEPDDHPLFAETVIPADDTEDATVNTASWSVVAAPVPAEGNNDPIANKFAGAIGTIGDNCGVTFTFNHNSVAIGVRAGVESAGDLGLICGSLGDGSVLTPNVTITGTEALDVKSTGGHVGSLVGVMGDGAKIDMSANTFTSFASVSTTGAGKYAGGIAGYVTNAELAGDFSISKNVTGVAGAGAVFGYYKSTTGNGTPGTDDEDVRTFDLSNITSSSLTLRATGSGSDTGGFIGALDAENDVVIDGGVTHTAQNVSTYPRTVALSSGSNRGGILGSYTTDSLSRSLTLKNHKISASGGDLTAGVLGRIKGTSPAYVKIQDIAVNASSGTLASALVGSMGSNGSFVDIDGQVSARGNYVCGLVRYENEGVIRIKGLTDFGGAYFGTSNYATVSTAQLVGSRGNGLVYALGSGSDTVTGYTSSGWSFRRSRSVCDDIEDWGEVLRLSTENGLTEASVFGVSAVDETSHTVTLADSVSAMGTVTDFIRTALIIQHNVDGNKGALCFATPGVTSATLLGQSSSLSLTADIDLKDTGIVAMTRDNGSNVAFAGTFDGAGHTISLAIGEPYGLNQSSGNPIDDVASPRSTSFNYNGFGCVINHTHQGLFAKSSGATFQNLTIAGFDNTSMSAANTYVGGVVAEAMNNLTLTNVTTSQINYLYPKKDNAAVGGAVGCYSTASSTSTVNVNECTFNTQIVDERSGDKPASKIYAGGAIGYVGTTGNVTFNFNTGTNGTKLGGTYTKTGNNAVCYGGLIGAFSFANQNASALTRHVNIYKVSVDDTFSVNNVIKDTAYRSSGSGAFLGGTWANVDVLIDGTSGVTIGSTSGSAKPTIAVTSGSTIGNIGALFYKVTGHMRVEKVTVNKALISSSYGSSTFGFIVNDTYFTDDSSQYGTLYLDVNNYDGSYNIANTDITGTYTVFDEIAGYSVTKSSNSDTDIVDNGQSIVSIRTAASTPSVIMTGEGCNTYQNQTSRGINDYNENSKTRYYYNLDYIRTKSGKTPAEKLLLWSVNTYAHSRLKSMFSGGYTTSISGNCDMEGYSYYPVNASGMTIASGSSITFYNDEIERGEEIAADNTDGFVRSTRDSDYQHYLMHSGVFLDYSGDLNVTNTTLKGNVGLQSFGSGFLVCRNYDNETQVEDIAINGLILDGAHVAGRANNNYSPLILNNIKKNVNLTLTGVKTLDTDGDYAALIAGGKYAASSLIGDVGASNVENINMTFSNMVLDARTTALSNTGANNSLTAAYNTARSIFDRATFLNSFNYTGVTSAGTYNYTYNEDWGSTAHQVTYAKEVTESLEYIDDTLDPNEVSSVSREQYYYKDSHHTNPVANTGTYYDFSSGFLPHVYNFDAQTRVTHEIRVNLYEVDITEGCGQYNDPYIITDGRILASVSKIIYGDKDGGIQGIKLMLPADLINGIDDIDMWCEAKANVQGADADIEYEFDKALYEGEGGFKQVDAPSVTLAFDTVREYLAQAYYKIGDDGSDPLNSVNSIDLPSDYRGLGSVYDWSDNSSDTCKFGFRGVIVGKNGTTVNINNNSSDPLIKNASGCVVKDVTVNVYGSVIVLQNNTNKFLFSSNSCFSYGAVIGQVMGGDNIIDCVGVTFTNAPAFTETSTNGFLQTRLAAVGGYVGAVVNGGVVFRNMADEENRAGLTAASNKYSGIADEGHLYANPIVGRVIAGYVFNESTSYVASSTIMNNGTKNYAICDLNPALAKLDVKSSWNVSIPNAQALYIFSCIVNSGAGSAAAYDSGESAYDDLGIWGAYREYTMTRSGSYADVGTNTVSDFSANVDGVEIPSESAGRTKIPYIIREYTVHAAAGPYYARRVSTQTLETLSLSENGQYVLPAGYRGIGSIYSNSSNLVVNFKCFDGKYNTLTLNMSYVEYNHKFGAQTNYNENSIDNYKPYEGNIAGFGLFNSLSQNKASQTNCIKDLKLSGSVFYDVKILATGSNIDYSYGWHNYNSQTGYYAFIASRLDVENNSEAKNTFLHVGALGGTCLSNVYLDNVSLDTITVEGAKIAGGLIGYSKGRNVTILKPSSSALTVKAGMIAGGLLGYFEKNGLLTIRGESAQSPAVIGLSRIEIKGLPSCAKLQTDEFASMFNCAGGLCGYVGTSTSNGSIATVSNVRVDGGIMTASQKMKRPNDMRYKIMLGGMFGRTNETKLDIDNFTLNGTVMDGSICGGLIAYATNLLEGAIDNVSIKGGTGKALDGTNVAGGLFGYVWNNKKSTKLAVASAFVEDYTIISSVSNAERANAGGFVGIAFNANSSWNSAWYFDISDSAIKNCTVSRCANNNDGGTAYLGVGGLFGAVVDRYNFTGHDISSEGVTIRLVSPGNRTPGLVCGTSNSAIKLVGVSVQGGSRGSLDAIAYNNDTGYIVFSDYNGVAISDEANQALATLANSDGNSVAIASPYVNVNPEADIGNSGFTLTGDGVMRPQTQVGNTTLTQNQRLAITNIISDAGRYYRTTGSLVSGFYSNYYSKLSSFKSEQGLDSWNSFTDFPVLIVDETNKTRTTEMITSYIKLLTNTTLDYSYNSSSNVYRIDMYRIDGATDASDNFTGFSKSASTANLKYDSTNHKYYMDNDSVDTSGLMFTLVDVKYFDPHVTSKVAYHLYIPVLVKKITMYTFEIATGSSTNYERDWYEENNRFGKALLENLGTPATIYFKYTYHRTKDEWQKALENGENLLGNYSKTLNLTKEIGASELPAGTKLVLVDPNNGGKEYYATFGTVGGVAGAFTANGSSTGGTLSLSAFKDSSGTMPFTSVPFCDLLDISVQQITAADPTAVLFKRCDPNSASEMTKATVKVGDDYYRKVADDETPTFNNNNFYCTLTVQNNAEGGTTFEDIVEPYYISFFTDAANNVACRYTVTTPGSLSDASYNYPSRIQHPDPVERESVQFALGNIFLQSGFRIEMTTLSDEISLSNRALTLDAETTITMTQAMKNLFGGMLDTGNGQTGIYVYHAFLVELTRHDSATTSTKLVAGDPTLSGTFTVSDHNGNAAGALAATNGTYYLTGAETHNYAQFVLEEKDAQDNPIKHLLNQYVLSNGAKISAHLTLTYGDKDSILEQFPSKKDAGIPDIGVTVAAKSNLAYDATSAPYSKASVSADDEDSHLYYCNLDRDSATLNYNVKYDAYEGDYGTLGINPLDTNSQTVIRVSTVGLYDYSRIVEDVEDEDYDYVYCAVKLYRKIVSEGADVYEQVSIPAHLTDLWLDGAAFTTQAGNGYAEAKDATANALQYEFTFPRSLATVPGELETTLQIPVDFNVLTGAPFEANARHYANYKVELTVALCKDDGTGHGDKTSKLQNSEVTKYIIYTNARLLPDFIVD